MKAPAQTGAAAERCLIVNADDFGRAQSINHGVIQGHQQGIVTSASLMVRWPSISQAAAYGRDQRTLSLGLHIDLGEWSYRHGAWRPIYERVRTDRQDEVSLEVRCQLELFRSLLGRNPTHIDSHQHVHRKPVVGRLIRDLAQELSIPLRGDPRIRYCGSFYGQTDRGMSLPDAITTEALLELVAALPDGITELGCHPGTGDDPQDTYNAGRKQELAALCDPPVRDAIAQGNIRLCSFETIQL